MPEFNVDDWLQSEESKARYASVVAMGTKCDWCETPGIFSFSLTWRDPYCLCKKCAESFDRFKGS